MATIDAIVAQYHALDAGGGISNRPGSCVEMAGDACDFMRGLGLPANLATGVVQGALTFAEPANHPSPAVGLVDQPDTTTRSCSSEWSFDPAHFVWRRERVFAPTEMTGALHEVAATELGGLPLLVDWGARQFADFPAEARMFC